MNSPGRNPLGLVSSHNHGPIPLQASIQRENLPTGDTDKRTRKGFRQGVDIKVKGSLQPRMEQSEHQTEESLHRILVKTHEI